jgi:sugar-specific transcriptional regulator TrmB
MFARGRYIGPWMQSNEGAAGGGGTGQEQNQNPPANQTQQQQNQNQDDPLDGLTEAQRKEIDRRMRAARKDGETAGKTAAQTEAEAAAEAARTERERNEQAARGEFDQVKSSLERERDGWKTKADEFKIRADRAIALLESRVEGQLKRLTERDADLAKAFPADADVLDQIAWLEDPRTKRIIDADDNANGTGQFRQPRTPTTQRSLSEAEKLSERAKALARSGQYSPY